MARPPSIPHQEIVDFILGGKTTLDAKEHFGFPSDNIANLRVHAAFKALGLQRPKYSEARRCIFCDTAYMADRRNRQTCGSDKCQSAFIVIWAKERPESRQNANIKFKRSPLGHQRNREQHAKKRELGHFGSIAERWAFAADEITKSLRKREHLAARNAWSYRIDHIQKSLKIIRQFRSRQRRDVSKKPVGVNQSKAIQSWVVALRACQTTFLQHRASMENNSWEKALLSVQSALRTGENLRSWKKPKGQLG